MENKRNKICRPIQHIYQHLYFLNRAAQVVFLRLSISLPSIAGRRYLIVGRNRSISNKVKISQIVQVRSSTHLDLQPFRTCLWAVILSVLHVRQFLRQEYKVAIFQSLIRSLRCCFNSLPVFSSIIQPSNLSIMDPQHHILQH